MIFRVVSAGRLACRAAAVVLLCPLLASAQQRQNGQLEGRVLAGDVAVPGAAIFASGGRVTLARVDGRYRMSLPVGRYEVRAQRIGYSSARDSFTVVAGQTTTANFRLDRALSRLEGVATVGTRGFERTAIEAPDPIDIMSGPELRATGRMATSRMLQALAPSVTAPRASIAEGSDLVHPITLRGMGPDQVLVLVNGHRRHTSALLNVNGSTGRGSTGVDLDAIPASMIERVEVLHDGAAAQYGPDAVAGVINVVLKSGVHGDATTTVGGNVTTYNRAGDAASYGAERSVRDGRSVQATIDKGVVFGERGFLHGDLELRSRDFSNRALDSRTLVPPPPTASPGSPPNYGANRLGDAGSRDLALILNGGNLFANGLELYGNVGGSRRTVDAAGRYRGATDPATNPVAYPNGFLPLIHPTIDDYAGTVGVRGATDDWRYNLSSTYGRNAVDYEIRDTQSGGGIAGTFDAGRVHYGQSTTGVDVTRTFDRFDELRLAAGVELRTESYGIGAGTPPLDIEGFSGFGAAQAIDRSRNIVAGRVNVEADLSPAVMLGVALRADRYSDVGTLDAGKAFFRFEPAAKLAVRGSVGHSSRAPSLAQSYYGNRLTDPGTSPYSSAVARVDDASALAAGASALRPERATNLSLGFASEVTSALSLTADLYRVRIEDRVVLLENLADASPSVPYFSSNAADTRTTGVDLSAAYAVKIEGGGLVRLAGGANINRTTVTQARSVGQLGVGRIGVTRLEHGQPEQNLLASAAYQKGTFGALLRTQRFGEVRTAGAQGSTSLDQTFRAKFVTDANVSLTLRRYTLTAGADNIFDVYPDRNNAPGSATTGTRGNGYFGIFPYNAVSPFGFNGRFVFGRLALYL